MTVRGAVARSTPMMESGVSTIGVLAPVYAGDRPDWFRRMLLSVARQTRQPDEVVIVVSGPVTPAHDEGLAEAEFLLGERLRVLRLPTNCGREVALNAGFAASRATFVARVDADDQTGPDRFG